MVTSRRATAALIVLALAISACASDDTEPGDLLAGEDGTAPGTTPEPTSEPVDQTANSSPYPRPSTGSSRPTPTPDADAPPLPPDVDPSIASVPIGEIYFDTFDGGAVRLSDSTPALRARLLDAIPPIDRPRYEAALGGAWLAPTDLLLGYIADGQAYAYPFKILNFHEIVNDELAGVPVLISYCPLCGSGIVYDRRVGDEVLSFGNTSALYESDLVMVDRTTGSYWWQVAGRAIVGPLTGSSLDVLPSITTTWADWSEDHPDTLVLSRTTGFVRDYDRDSFAGYANRVNQGGFAFPVDETGDGRLLPAAQVVGVAVGEVTRAYPVDDLTAPVNDVLAGAPLVLIPVDGGAAVFESTLDGEALTFERRGSSVVDVETGSVWDTGGVATAGPMAGTQLSPIPSRSTFWFAFLGAFPSVEVYGG